jgi:parvulin-like peptidyl-prolyl isomerase
MKQTNPLLRWCLSPVKPVLFGVVLSLVLAISTNRYAAATELARVNQTVITAEEFEKKYQENLKFFQLKAPTKKGVLDDLIKRELGLQEAKKLGLDKDPDVVDRMNTVLYHALLEKKLNKDFDQISVSDSEAKSFYSKNPEIRTSHIFVALRAGATAEEEKKALARITDIRDQHLKPGKMSFAEIAQRFSDGVAAPVGGDLDYNTKEKLDPLYYEAAVKLKTPGAVSGIVRSNFGYHIIKLTGVRPWDETDQAQIKRLVYDEKRSDVFERYMASLRKQSKIVINAGALK